MTVQKADPAKKHFEQMQARDKNRLFNPETGLFLHNSGSGETKILHYSWLGFVKQADVLKGRAMARGEPWPYRLAHRGEFESEFKREEEEA